MANCGIYKEITDPGSYKAKAPALDHQGYELCPLHLSKYLLYSPESLQLKMSVVMIKWA